MVGLEEDDEPGGFKGPIGSLVVVFETCAVSYFLTTMGTAENDKIRRGSSKV